MENRDLTLYEFYYDVLSGNKVQVIGKSPSGTTFSVQAQYFNPLSGLIVKYLVYDGQLQLEAPRL